MGARDAPIDRPIHSIETLNRYIHIMKKKWLFVGLGLFTLPILLIVVAYATAYHPDPVEDVPIVEYDQAPLLPHSKALKVMSWNVQFLAGKGYVFFFDVLGGKGPHERPTPEDIAQTWQDVVRIVKEENPDILLLQEVDDGAKRTDEADQLELLRTQLKGYKASASAFYWKAPFVPHPRIMGSVGLKLSVLSQWKIHSAKRVELPQVERAPVMRWFDFHRALLDVRILRKDGSELAVLNTHLEAFGKDGSIKKREITFLQSYFDSLEKENIRWVLGADMNLLPPGFYSRIPTSEKVWFQDGIDLDPLYARKGMVLPLLKDLMGPDSNRFKTHDPNRLPSHGLDKTIDFICLDSQITLHSYHVRQGDAIGVSDHMPLIAEISLP